MSVSNPLEASERKMQARNEKSRFFAEAGEHLWLPPGARAVNEQEQEAKMLELAIRISLEEEAIRKRQEGEEQFLLAPSTRVPPPLPRRPLVYSQTLNTVSVAAPAPLPPKRPLPHLPILDPNSNASSSDSHNSTSPPSTPNSPQIEINLTSKPSIAFIAPSRPRIFSFSTNDGSPEERPYLTSESFTTAQENQIESSQVDDLVSRSDSHGTFGTKEFESSNGRAEYHSAESSSNFDSGRQSFESASSDSSNILAASTLPSNSNHESDSLSVRNPCTPTAETENEGKFSPFRNSLTGRSMSLISERTEPSNQSTTSVSAQHNLAFNSTGVDEDLNTPSSGSFRIGADREKLSVGASPTLLARIQKEKQDGIYNGSRWSTDSSRNDEVAIRDNIGPSEILQDPLPSLSASSGQFQEHLDLSTSSPPLVTDESPRLDSEEERHQPVVFGNGIRFGLTNRCADELDHSCSEDGLTSKGPFPDKIVLSGSVREDGIDSSRKFAIESYTWTSLLRLLMWQVFPKLQR